MHNLLSLPERTLRRRQYQIRRVVVGLILLACVLVITAFSLVPSLLEVLSERSFVEREAQALEELLREGGDRVPRDILQETSVIRAELAVLMEEKPNSETVRTLLNARPEGVTVSALTLDRPQRTAVLEGVATRRDTLVTYARALEGVPLVENAVLPISDLAKSSDLEWRMTITLSSSTVRATPTP